MNWTVPAAVPTESVIWFVALFQAWIFRRSWRLACQDDKAAFDDLLARFIPDLVARAKRGDDPDWMRYVDDADRLHERRSDRLRVHANAALAAGIGGTMVALVLHLLPSVGSGPASVRELAPLIPAMSAALFASLVGVLNNLLITLWLMRRAGDRFAKTLQGFKDRLHEASIAHPPHETFAEAVKSQLGDAFREAVQKFPEAFERLDENVEALAAAIERQSTSVLAAATRLGEGAERLAGVAADVAGATVGLTASSDQLRALPEQIRTTLDAARDAWEQAVRRDQQTFVVSVKEVLSHQQALLEQTKAAFDEWESKRRKEADAADGRHGEVVATVARIVAIVDTLPAMFSTEVEKVSSKLGRQFGLEARHSVQDLQQSIAVADEKLRTHIGNATRELRTSFLNSTSDVVAGTVTKTIEHVHQRVETTLLASLDEVGRGLREAMTDLPNNAASFAQSLATADQKITDALDGIKASSDHLGRVAALTEGLEASLTDALKAATASGVEPLQEDVGKLIATLDSMVEQLRQGHERVDGMVENLIAFIRNLIEEVARRRDTA